MKINHQTEVAEIDEEKVDIEHLVNSLDAKDVVQNGVSLNDCDDSNSSVSEKTCCVVSAEVHNEDDVMTADTSDDTVSKNNSVVDIVHREKYALNGDLMKKRASQHVSYKERAKKKVSMLIHRHTL